MRNVANRWFIQFFVLLTFFLSIEGHEQSFLNGPFGNGFYRQQVIYPNGQIQGSLGFKNTPLSINSGYSLNVPPFLPRFPPFQQQAWPGTFDTNPFQRNPFSSFFTQTPIPTAESLFTPTTTRQPAETVGQVENFRKALEEERKEKEKEQQELEQTTFTQFGETSIPFSLESTDEPKSYVTVKVGEDKQVLYNYQV